MNSIKKNRNKRWRFWFLFVVLPVTTICLLLIGFGIYVKKRSGTQYFVKGRIYANSNRNIEAIEEFKKALTKKPNDEYIHYHLGISYIKLKEYENAMQEFEAALKINPNLHDASIEQAVINLITAQKIKKQGKNESLVRENLRKSEDICKDLIEKKPKLTRAYTLLAEINLEQGLIDKAIKNYKNALEHDNSLKYAHIALARLYVHESKFDLAEEQCNIILSEIDHNNYQTQILLSRIYVQQGKFNEAITCLKQILEKKPDDITVRTRLGMLYLQTLKYDEAYSEVEQVEKLSSSSDLPALANFVKGSVLVQRKDYANAISPLSIASVQLPELMQAHYYLAITLLKLGRTEQAKTQFQKSINIDPNFVPAQLEFAKLLVRDGSHERTIELCKKILTTEPENVEALQTLGEAYIKIQSLENAVEQYRKVISINPNNAYAHLHLGIIFESKNLFKESINAYKKVIELEPASPVAYNNLAWLYISKTDRKLEDALKLAKKAKELALNSYSIGDTLGWIYYLIGMYDEAMSELETAVKAAPEIPTIHYHLGMVYHKKGLTKLALNEMDNALKINSSFPEAKEAREFIERMKTQLK